MKKLKTQFKSMNGITLIALIITVIIMLILAGVTITQLARNGILDKIMEAKDQNEIESIKEVLELKKLEAKMKTTTEGGVLKQNYIDILKSAEIVKDSDITEAGENINIVVNSKYVFYLEVDTADIIITYVGLFF